MNKTIFKLRLNFFFWLLLALLTLVLFETECWLPGAWAGEGMTEGLFFLQNIVVIVTLGIIPVALKLLHWTRVKRLITCDNRQGREAYLRWSMVRCGALGVCLLLNLFIYYNVLEKANALCALILLLAYFFCWPSAAKMKAETESME